MSELPKNWILTTLGEVCEILDSQRIPINSDERNERISGKPQSQLLPYYGATGQVGVIDGFLFEGEHILLGEDGAPFLEAFKDKAYMVDGKFWVNNHAHILRAHVSNRYLCHYLNQLDYSDHVTGTTRLKLTQAALKIIPVKFPPANEQKRIVAKIEELFSELDKGIESLKTARAQLKVYRQAVLKHAFEGKLTADWREKNKDKLESADKIIEHIPSHRRKNLDDVTNLELDKFPELPANWKYTRLGYFIDSISAGKSFKCDEREPTQEEIGVAKVSAVTWGKYDEHESKTCIDSDKVHPEYFIKSGDFLFSRANTIELVGACVIAKTVTKKIMLSDKTLRINFGNLAPYYFLYYLRSQMGRNEIMKRSTGNQDSMRNIGQDRIRNIILPVCSPLEAAQITQEIHEKFSIIENLESTIEAELQKSEALRQAILKKAFSGQLVAQDPADEPASVLLERIRTEKETQTVKKKPKEKRRAA